VLLAQRLGVSSDEVDGWTVATRLSATSFELGNRDLRVGGPT